MRSSFPPRADRRFQSNTPLAIGIGEDRRRWLTQLTGWLLITASLWACVGCLRSGATPEVIVYCALDSVYAEPIFAEFQRQTGIRVRAKYDAESTKTVQLVAALIAEGKRQTRCDVFWNNEILNTIRLERMGLLHPYASPEAAAYPAQFRSPTGHWHGFAARARILLVNTDIVAKSDRPSSLDDLTDSRWKGKIGIAKPLFGSTATHAACLYAGLGDAAAENFFRRLKANQCQVLSGNKQVAEAVSTGQIAFGLTDTDDGLAELAQGHPVEIVYPDGGEEQMGTLFFPNTVSVMRGAPHRELAEKLVDFLLSAATERALAEGGSGQIPLREDLQDGNSVSPVRGVAVDFGAAAECWETSKRAMQALFAGPD